MTVDLDNEPGSTTQPTVRADAPAPMDGRHARSERSRRAMVDALLDLLRAGVMRPSSAQIAERAGVTQRTLFNQFGDMDSLISAVASRQVERVLNLMPTAGDGCLEERVDRYCDGLMVLLEETMNVRWAVVTNTTTLTPATTAVANARQFVRRRLSDEFGAELDKLDDEAAGELIEALEIETDPVMWRMRRVQQELTPEQARDIVARTIRALLRDAIREAEPATAGA